MKDKFRVLAGIQMLVLSLGSLYAFEIKIVGATPGEDRYPVAALVQAAPDEVRIIVAFEYELSETDHDIYIAWTNNFGRDWNLRAASTSTCDERHPRIAAGVDATLHLVFQSADTLGYVYASAYNLNWISTIWASTWSQACRHPDVAVDTVTDCIWLVMEEAETSSSSNIKACYLSPPDNEGKRTYQPLSVAQDTKSETWPAVACDANNVLVLYEYHDGTNTDIRGALSKTSTPMFSSVQVAHSPASEYHPQIISAGSGFEYLYQTDDSLYYGLSADGSPYEMTAISAAGTSASPMIDGNGISTDIIWHSDSVTLSHIRLTGQDPETGKLQNSPAVHRITPGERQLEVVTTGDSALCIWSGTQMGSANIFGTWWSTDHAFGINEHLNPDYDTRLVASPNITSNTCRISFVSSSEGRARLEIYDETGRLVRTLLDKRVLPAYFTIDWDGLDNRGTPLQNGLYFVKLQDDDGVRTAKVVLAK